jgi:GTP-binding protein
MIFQGGNYLFMDIRNIAIIAHVDHGKTTLVDFMLKQTHTFRDNEAEMSQTTILDSNAQERERGITILAKNTAVFYKGTKINIIDTPGHSDFSGEIERTINMADGALLIVDAAEGPLPQTQFVLEQAFKHNLKLIVVINKIDRKDARPKEVLHEIEELFLHLATHEDHLHFPVLYAIGREGKVWKELKETDGNDPDYLKTNEKTDLTVLFDTILEAVPPPKKEVGKPFKMLVSTLDFDPHKGSFAIGKILAGTVVKNQTVLLMKDQQTIGQFRIEEVFTSMGLKRIPAEIGETGDIIALTGIDTVGIGMTITDPSDPIGLPSIKIEEPTLKVVVSANTSPFGGRDGKFSTAGQLSDRLIREKSINIGIRIEQNPEGTGFVVAGRGELHLAVLLENLRREGYEMQVGKPEVILKEIDGVLSEPFEEITIEIDSMYIGVITEELGKRKAELVDTRTDDRGIAKIVYKISSRNLLGFRGDILTKTRGNGIFATRIIGYQPVGSKLNKIRNGVFVSLESGKATAYSLEALQARGKSFIHPGTQVYEGMILGENSRSEDIDINIIKFKKLTNMHTENSDVAVQLDPPVIMTLEQCLDYIEDDELVEITPNTLRLRKKQLTKVGRVRAKRIDDQK